MSDSRPGDSWEEDASKFAADLVALSPPVTWVELARMARAQDFPTAEHRAVYDTWKERADRHYSEAGATRSRSGNVTPIPKTGKK